MDFLVEKELRDINQGIQAKLTLEVQKFRINFGDASDKQVVVEIKIEELD